MGIQRRQLLRLSGTGLLLAALPGLAMSSNVLYSHAVSDDAAFPMFKTGDLLVVDSSCKDFAGAGIYLYPAWGRPRPYLVTAAPGGRLQFSNPGSGNALWIQTISMDSGFAGRVVEEGIQETLKVASLSPLQLPVLPSAAVV